MPQRHQHVLRRERLHNCGWLLLRHSDKRLCHGDWRLRHSDKRLRHGDRQLRHGERLRHGDRLLRRHADRLLRPRDRHAVLLRRQSDWQQLRQSLWRCRWARPHRRNFTLFDTLLCALEHALLQYPPEAELTGCIMSRGHPH